MSAYVVITKTRTRNPSRMARHEGALSAGVLMLVIDLGLAISELLHGRCQQLARHRIQTPLRAMPIS